MAWLGPIWLLLFFGTPITIGWLVFRLRGGAGGAEHRRRARLIERQTRYAVHDTEVMDDVLRRMADERRHRDGRWR
jgi:hypothetical protein